MTHRFATLFDHSETGAHFVKTSTAYAEGGATLDDVRAEQQRAFDPFLGMPVSTTAVT